jgi:four helix bundle protein
MQHFTKLQVWQRSHRLAQAIFTLTSSFPIEDRYTLTAQLRRAALSVPTNIAEGSKRRSNAEFAHFINISEGPLSEVEYLLIFSRDMGRLNAKTATTLLQEVSEIARMLNALRVKVLAASKGTPSTARLSTVNC